MPRFFQRANNCNATERAEAELKTLLNKPSAEQERAEIKKGIYKISKQRVAIVKEYKV